MAVSFFREEKMFNLSLLSNFPLFYEIAQNKMFSNVWLFCKNENAGYIAGNDLVAEDLDLVSAGEICKKTDYDFNWSAERIAFLRDWDLQVINSKTGIYKVEEPFLLPSGKQVEVLSYKLPLNNQEGSVIGLVGITFKLNDWNSSFNLLKYLNPQNTSELNSELINKTGLPFTRRETEVLYCMLQGKSAREIGDILSISKRTVECHINSMKEKMMCRKKSELLDKVLKILAS